SGFGAGAPTEVTRPLWMVTSATTVSWAFIVWMRPLIKRRSPESAQRAAWNASAAGVRAANRADTIVKRMTSIMLTSRRKFLAAGAGALALAGCSKEDPVLGLIFPVDRPVPEEGLAMYKTGLRFVTANLDLKTMT